jgi:hypothetical protein
MGRLVYHIEWFALRIRHNLWSTLSVAHLYNAAKQRGFLTENRQDMDGVIQNHSAEFLFFGSYLKRLRIASSASRSLVDSPPDFLERWRQE